MISKAQLDASYGARNMDLLNRLLRSYQNISDNTHAVSRFRVLLEDGAMQNSSRLKIDTNHPSATLLIVKDGIPIKYRLWCSDQTHPKIELNEEDGAESFPTDSLHTPKEAHS